MSRQSETKCLLSRVLPCAKLLLLVVLPTNSQAAPTIQFALDGNSITGTPLAWSDRQVMVLARDGFLWQFQPEDATDFQQRSPNFQPFSQSEMRGQLLREFGPQFDVSGTGNYLVVHPAGQRDRWALRFENLYRSFVHYFSVRGFFPETPQLPLVAIVFHSQAKFASYVRSVGGLVHPGTLGFYSIITNRIILYDVTNGQPDAAHWHVNADTIIHEATHQMAFNTGVHGRFAPPPRWLAEGLATLFESPGVWNNRQFRNEADRINRGRLAAFQHYATDDRWKGSLARLIQNSDRVFATTPSRAYAESWALTFFLTETEPAKYMRYMAKTAARQPLTDLSADAQLREFTDVFGDNLNMLEARLLRFLADQK